MRQRRGLDPRWATGYHATPCLGSGLATTEAVLGPRRGHAWATGRAPVAVCHRLDKHAILSSRAICQQGLRSRRALRRCVAGPVYLHPGPLAGWSRYRLGRQSRVSAAFRVEGTPTRP